MQTAGYVLVNAGRATKVADGNVNLGLCEDTDGGGEKKQLSVLLYANTERQYRLFGTGSPGRLPLPVEEEIDTVLLYANTERQYRLLRTGNPPRTSTSAVEEETDRATFGGALRPQQGDCMDC